MSHLPRSHSWQEAERDTNPNLLPSIHFHLPFSPRPPALQFGDLLLLNRFLLTLPSPPVHSSPPPLPQKRKSAERSPAGSCRVKWGGAELGGTWAGHTARPAKPSASRRVMDVAAPAAEAFPHRRPDPRLNRNSHNLVLLGPVCTRELLGRGVFNQSPRSAWGRMVQSGLQPHSALAQLLLGLSAFSISCHDLTPKIFFGEKGFLTRAPKPETTAYRWACGCAAQTRSTWCVNCTVVVLDVQYPHGSAGRQVGRAKQTRCA